MWLKLNINDEIRSVEATPETPLLYILRDDFGLNGPKFGCGLGQCGACTVHVEGVAVRSCVTPVGSLKEKSITTLEGLGSRGNPHPLQTAFIEQQALQCGYCSNGMIMTAAAFLAKKPHPTEIEIRHALSGNLCRCGTHTRIIKAIKAAAKGAGA
ncbi:MAG: (2Fe-2S)-binding protein [Sphingomonadales bacterium]